MTVTYRMHIDTPPVAPYYGKGCVNVHFGIYGQKKRKYCRIFMFFNMLVDIWTKNKRKKYKTNKP